ncbi:MAG: SDR family NAD(P)-dependent oxidoreductase, partial [Desulfobacterales bacterium]|nr:SDR family NAD(P)-dependent oxidoreductase [Desulfobacterales bacterium]
VATGKNLIQLVVTGGDAHPWLYGLAGMLKTASLENPGLVCQLIDLEPPASQKEFLETIGETLLENGARPGDRVIQYGGGKRWDKRWVERMEEVETDPSGFTWSKACVCLITGGLGGLGLMFAQEIAGQVSHPTLILTGRSEPDAEKLAEIDRLNKMGARVVYRQADVGNTDEVTALIHHIETTYGPLTGVIHSAGCIRDNFIIRKSVDECVQVMAPKVGGLVNLDAATQDQPLDFFVIFSSMAGSLGNIGQADYASANAFAGGYAAHRNRLVDASERQGRTVSIHWPLWKDGGMTVGAETEEMMRRNMGMTPMETEAGIQGFYRAVAAGHPHIMVIQGDVPTIRRKLLAPAQGPATERVPVPSPADDADDNELRGLIRSMLVKEVSQMMGIPRDAVDGNVALEKYGFDSISMTEFTNTLNGEYGIDLAPTVFFEYPDVDGLSDYLATEHQAAFSARLTGTGPSRVVDSAPAEDATRPAPSRRRRHSRFGTFGPDNGRATVAAEPVAIVGISGRFPMAEDIGTFWENLANGKDCITEIPEDRWDWKALHAGGEDTPTPMKWGGFIDGVDEFDPSFFEISPREAELMEPQQRLMMRYVWKAIEDAGIPAESLAGTKTGLFVGTGGNQYAEILAKANIPVEGYTSTGSVPSIGPNRMSYFLDIHGPSEPVETSCSSSLIAIHRAVEAMANGSCDMAVVGGVNTIITPSFHLSFGNAGMLSPDGKCKTFSDRADGYVRGEGVGMLFLKKLSRAEQAGDHIYGVIRGTAVNHGGRSSSLTAPNPKAQKEVLVQAYRKSGIDPRTVGYIEAHGTGTNLGDPIEVEALKTAFKELYADAGVPEAAEAHCGLGSVKSNIGHTELAAGVSGVIKVLLQMQHRTIARSLHCDTVNPYIRLDDTPFYIAREAREWTAPTDAEGRILPRRAGVSSFGFGGANAHVILEEYVDDTPAAYTGNQPSVFVLSAKNEPRLRDYARVMADFLAGTHADLADIAYTVQTGRDAMDERLGLVVGSVEDLRDNLSRFADGSNDVDGLYHANARQNREAMTAFTSDDELLEAVDKWVARGKYAKLVSFWVRGLAFDWHRLYGDVRPRRISLPTYPFARDRYWIDAEATGNLQPGYLAAEEEDIQNAIYGDMMLKPMWREKKAESEAGIPAYTKHLIALCGIPNAKTAEAALQPVRAAFGDAEIINLEVGTKARTIHKRFSHCALTLFEKVQAVVQSKPKGKVLIQVVVTDGHGRESRLFSGLSGILKTARLENPAVIGQVIRVEDADGLEDLLGENSKYPEDANISYRDGKRLVAGFEEILDLPETPAMAWKDDGVYLITGGAGGLGLIFAEDIAQKVKTPVLLLTGRSAPGPDTRERIEALRNTGARVEYRQSDITRKADTDKLIRGITAEFGSLTGIIHSAGVIRDNFILNKTSDEFDTVLAPKVAGVSCLDDASKNLDLDFFVMFSSGVGAVGNTGQADYACANAYMD